MEETPDNPWRTLPLADYEGHMTLPAVDQARMLADVFALALREHAPPSVAIAGCAGGNGFERIDPQVTRRVVGIDINPAYLAVTRKRHAQRLAGLELYAVDLGVAGPECAPVDLVHAALFFEYVDVPAALAHLVALLKFGGVLQALIQLPGNGAVSPSPFRRVQALAPFMRLVAPDALDAAAGRAGLQAIEAHRVPLPSGKAFAVHTYRRGAPANA